MNREAMYGYFVYRGVKLKNCRYGFWGISRDPSRDQTEVLEFPIRLCTVRSAVQHLIQSCYMLYN